MNAHILWLDQLGMADLHQVGGKNASLGEMIGQLSHLGVSVPGGFATTADAFREFIEINRLSERIFERLQTLDIEDVTELARVGKEIRGWVADGVFPPALEQAVRGAYAELCTRIGTPDAAVAGPPRVVFLRDGVEVEEIVYAQPVVVRVEGLGAREHVLLHAPLRKDCDQSL